MAYAVLQDIVATYGEDALYVAADRDSNDAVDTVAVDRALAWATETINESVRKKYSLPLQQVPVTLVELCVDLALYRLSIGPAMTERITARFETAMRKLKEIANGDVVLDLANNTTGESSGSAELISNERIFSRKTMGGLL